MNIPLVYFVQLGPPSSPFPKMPKNLRVMRRPIHKMAHTEYVTTLVTRVPVWVLKPPFVPCNDKNSNLSKYRVTIFLNVTCIVNGTYTQIALFTSSLNKTKAISLISKRDGDFFG